MTENFFIFFHFFPYLLLLFNICVQNYHANKVLYISLEKITHIEYLLLCFIILWLLCLFISEEQNNVLYSLSSGSKKRKHMEGVLICK